MIMHKTLASTRLAVLMLGAALIGSGKATADVVFPDDVIVQGSLCVGLDCINNEPFGFDTIRLKENNTRILFMDTSVAPFPSNDWMLTANDSASGGANKFSIEDITGAKVPFTVTAGAPNNSMFVASTGKVGFRTSAPVLDLHVATSDTPAHRFEQTNAGGFTAQTWDVAGNEANFFVRDVTGGSRLPFRIRPGAPTSSIDIAASGNVGIGTASPGFRIHAVDTNTVVSKMESSGAAAFLEQKNTDSDWLTGPTNGNTPQGWGLFSVTGNAYRIAIDGSGNVGMGVTAPAARLHTIGTVRFAGVGNCTSGIQSNINGDLSCLASSRQFKNVAGDLPSNVALANIMALRPQTGSFKTTPDVPEHWFIAEEVANVDPALVGLDDGKPYVVKTQNVVADLVAVVQEQQRQIEELKRLVAAR
jgi:hypothetical protein